MNFIQSVLVEVSRSRRVFEATIANSTRELTLSDEEMTVESYETEAVSNCSDDVKVNSFDGDRDCEALISEYEETMKSVQIFEESEQLVKKLEKQIEVMKRVDSFLQFFSWEQKFNIESADLANELVIFCASKCINGTENHNHETITQFLPKTFDEKTKAGIERSYMMNSIMMKILAQKNTDLAEKMSHGIHNQSPSC
jgi:hypothetical protein